MNNTRKFIVKIAIKIILYIVVITLVTSLGIFNNPIIANKIALGQMANDDVTFMAMEAYYKLKPVTYIVVGAATILFVIAIIRDIKKYISKIKENKEK